MSVAGSFSIFLFPYVCACRSGIVLSACRYGIGEHWVVRSGGFVFCLSIDSIGCQFLFYLFVPMCVLVLVDTESASTTSSKVASIYLYSEKCSRILCRLPVLLLFLFWTHQRLTWCQSSYVFGCRFLIGGGMFFSNITLVRSPILFCHRNVLCSVAGSLS